jgi:hypothetical protein
MTEDRLRKVLELERSKRFSDRAVTAGLDSFLKNLTTHEGSQLSSDVFARIQVLPVAGYRSLTPAKRKEWLEGVLASLRDGGSEKLEARNWKPVSWRIPPTSNLQPPTSGLRLPSSAISPTR